jgi:hypothetical protein
MATAARRAMTIVAVLLRAVPFRALLDRAGTFLMSVLP